MDALSSPHARYARRATALTFAIIAASLAGQVHAGCTNYVPQGAPTDFEWNAKDAPAAQRPDGFLSTVYRPDAPVRMLRVDARDADRPGIVGTWRFTFVSDGTAYPAPIPFGAVIDFGTMQWHSDGTEFTISGGRPPSSGDVCMGSWEQTGSNTYTLKHIALGWASSDSSPPVSPAVYVGPGILRTTVTLNRTQDAFEGPFTIDAYAKDEVTLLEHISGKLTATRFGVH